MGNLVNPLNTSVLNKKYIESPYYTGEIIQLSNHWPWFQITGFELTINKT